MRRPASPRADLRFGSGTGSDTSPPDSPAPETPRATRSLWQDVRLLFKRIRDKENWPEIKAMLYEFGPQLGRRAMSFTFVLGMLTDGMFNGMTEKGKKMSEDILKEREKAGTSAPLLQLRGSLKAFGKKDDNALKKLRDGWNKFWQHLLPDTNEAKSKLRPKLELQEDTRRFRVLTRAHLANQNGVVSWLKRTSMATSRFGIARALGKLKVPLLAAGMALQGILMIFNKNAAKELIAKTFRRAA